MTPIKTALMSLGAAAATIASPAIAQDAGATKFQQTCAVCHAATKGAPSKLGPNLAGVIGRRAASLPGYTYSPAMMKSGLVWKAATLDTFLAKPMATVPGTKMGFGGLSQPADRAAVMAYLAKQK